MLDEGVYILEQSFENKRSERTFPRCMKISMIHARCNDLQSTRSLGRDFFSIGDSTTTNRDFEEPWKLSGTITRQPIPFSAILLNSKRTMSNWQAARWLLMSRRSESRLAFRVLVDKVGDCFNDRERKDYSIGRASTNLCKYLWKGCCNLIFFLIFLNLIYRPSCFSILTLSQENNSIRCWGLKFLNR